MYQTARNTLRAVTRYIPGFRSGSATGRALAVTYYAVVAAIALASWPWGVAMLCLPFLCFALVGLSHTLNRRANLVTVVAAGAVLLVMSALGLGMDGYRPKADAPQPVALAAAAPQAAAASKLIATPSAAPSPIATSTAIAPAIDTPTAAVIATPTIEATVSTPADPTAAPTVTTPAAAGADEPVASVYVASKNGKVFHLPTCSSAKNIKPENRLEFASREAAMAKGLSPCKRCKP